MLKKNKLGRFHRKKWYVWSKPKLRPMHTEPTSGIKSRYSKIDKRSFKVYFKRFNLQFHWNIQSKLEAQLI